MTIIFKKRETTNRIVLHDSHTPPDLMRALGYIRWQGRKLGLLEIGYHFVIERDGNRLETRPRAIIGQASAKGNRTSIHICLMGGADADGRPDDNFTEDQRITLFDTVAELRRQYGPLPLMGHDEVDRSLDHQCPRLDMVDLRQDMLTYKATGGSVV